MKVRDVILATAGFAGLMSLTYVVSGNSSRNNSSYSISPPAANPEPEQRPYKEISVTARENPDREEVLSYLENVAEAVPETTKTWEEEVRSNAELAYQYFSDEELERSKLPSRDFFVNKYSNEINEINDITIAELVELGGENIPPEVLNKIEDSNYTPDTKIGDLFNLPSRRDLSQGWEEIRYDFARVHEIELIRTRLESFHMSESLSMQGIQTPTDYWDHLGKLGQYMGYIPQLDVQKLQQDYMNFAEATIEFANSPKTEEDDERVTALELEMESNWDPVRRERKESMLEKLPQGRNWAYFSQILDLKSERQEDD